MINPHIAIDLRRAAKTFRKAGRYALAAAATQELGRLADTINPDEAHAHHLINQATGIVHA